jgi:hypothetical protein
MAEYVCSAISAEYFCHVLRRKKNLVKFVYITVLTSDVLFYNLAVINKCIVLFALYTNNPFKVAVRDVVHAHLGRKEMCHHWVGVVYSHMDTTFFRVTESCPIVHIVSVVRDR